MWSRTHEKKILCWVTLRRVRRVVSPFRVWKRRDDIEALWALPSTQQTYALHESHRYVRHNNTPVSNTHECTPSTLFVLFWMSSPKVLVNMSYLNALGADCECTITITPVFSMFYFEVITGRLSGMVGEYTLPPVCNCTDNNGSFHSHYFASLCLIASVRLL